MKKSLLLISSLVLLTCSGDDKGSNPGTTRTFTIYYNSSSVQDYGSDRTCESDTSGGQSSADMFCISLDYDYAVSYKCSTLWCYPTPNVLNDRLYNRWLTEVTCYKK